MMEVTQPDEQIQDNEEEKIDNMRPFMTIQENHELKYDKMATCADIKGQKYEIKMAALLFLRGINSGTKFFLASNISGVGQFDDLVFMQNNRIFLVQLKHKRNKVTDKFYPDRKFPDISPPLMALQGDFSVPQYFRSYAECRNWLHNYGLYSTINNTQFVLFTNRALQTRSECFADQKNVLFTEGHVYCFTELKDDTAFSLLQQLENYSQILRGKMVRTEFKNPDIKKKLQNLKLNKMCREKELRMWGDLSDYREFLSRFRIYSSQSNEKGLDTLIKIEIRRACMANDIHIDNIFDRLFKEMEDWWENKNFFLTEKTKFWQDIMCSHIRNLCSIRTLNVEFREEEYLLIRTFLIFNQILQIESDSIDLTCTKVCKSLVKYSPLLVDGTTLHTWHGEMFTIWKRWCDILVILVRGNVDIVPFLDVLKCTEKKLIIIGGKIARRKILHKNYIHYDRVSLNQLSEHWQRRVLETFVRFQGQNVPFGDIVCSYADFLTADMIAKILGERVTLEDIPTDDIDYYVPRTLRLIGKENLKFENVDSVLNIPLKVVVVSAEPGMGKSTLLTHLVLGTKQACPAIWVIRVNLNDYTQQINKQPDDIKLSHVIEFLLEVSKIPECWKPMFTFKLEKMENVCIFFDGYDEVSPTHTEKVADMLKILQNSHVKKLWVTTRPIMRGNLEHYLNVTSLSLQPFSKTDQKNFLVKFWKRSKPEIESIILNKFISALLKLIAMNLNDRDRDFTGIPLQSLLLAEAFEKDLNDYLEKGIFQLNPKIDLLELYSRFVDRKLQIYYSKNNIDMTKPSMLHGYEPQFRHTFEMNHMMSALVALIPKEELDFGIHKNGIHIPKKILSKKNMQISKLKRFHDPFNIIENVETFLKNIELGTEKTGIIRDVLNGKPMFIHRTFAEYFAALWFAKNYSKVRDYLERNIFSPNFHVVRKFFDRILAQNHKLHVAILSQNKESLENLLIEGKVEVDERDEGGRTALHLAVVSYLDAKESVDVKQSCMTANAIISMLLEYGASHNIKDDVLRWRPLRLADKFNALAVIDLILKRQGDVKDLITVMQNINKKEYVQQILEAAARNGFVNLIDFLLKRGINIEQDISVLHVYKTTALHEAASQGQLEVVKFLVKNKADVNAEDEWCKRTPLLWAAEQGETEIVKFLLKNGSRVNIRDKFDDTALHIAAVKGHWDIVNLLVQCKPDITFCDVNGNTLLHHAAQSGVIQCVSTLLKMGLDINARNKRLESPLLRAAWWGKYEIVRLLVHCEADVTAIDKDGNTALHAAAKSGNVDILEYLLDIGLDVDSRNLRNETPVSWAAWFGRLEAVKCLCENGADLQVKDSICGFTPLHAATSEGHLEVIEYLVRHGASLFECDMDGNTPLQVGKAYCFSDNRKAVINFFEKLPC